MLNIQLARKYGVAIFEIAKEENKLEEYGKELAKVSKDLFSHADLKGFLTNPQVQPQAKTDILSKLVQGEISDLMFKFLLLLVDKRRIVLRPGGDRAVDCDVLTCPQSEIARAR